ncbi:L,D-transpeptidase family protein [Bacillus aquiflavi]|uniref:L,D-transpeptidase family protein n=1 Tax=Bacillus aquiflavi TaxID=2672567 RepID=A0A6B3W1X8_9BACI|nr:L,D-transpeptidase family protein [Bacillus aquiflavi]MBA4538167.1 L,D-transpeptidase family protein [Bacillus aquiflavi]NEY82487.1 L,D-transpeptidase family protein [Bacillus aquiflavi]UAC48104.1 L,D-transpeptidase/peptidoglycan binding protein [Bacillus aquiflavi]
MGLVKKTDKEQGNQFKLLANRWFFISGMIIIIVLIFAGMSYYQTTRFNSNVMINGIKVGGLTAEEAINKLKASKLKNRVFIEEQLILDEKDTPMPFTDQDRSEVKKLLKKQRTFFPSSKVRNYSLTPKKADQFRSQTMKKQVEEKLLSMNESLKGPQDAVVKWEQDKIVISESINGEQYDVAALLKDYQKQIYSSDIHLKPVFIQPIKADDPIIKENTKKLENFMQQTLEYKVQDKVHLLKASELIKSASISKDGKVTIIESDMKNKIAEINDSQSTLNKDFTFKTHSGKVISVKGQGYGWAINVEKETAMIHEAFENGKESISASNIYGNGWNNEGVGYETTTNNGIGDTYAEVSLAEQRIWIYKNGELVVTTNVVTGKQSTNEGTSPGVWYILYKRTPYTLRGSAVGNPNYSADVNYWAPFTNDGQGFHDASWRTNWANDAYLSDGSAGCVNTPPSEMKSVYDHLNTYDPVVVY